VLRQRLAARGRRRGGVTARAVVAWPLLGRFGILGSPDSGDPPGARDA
jgi:hypothetical protein